MAVSHVTAWTFVRNFLQQNSKKFFSAVRLNHEGSSSDTSSKIMTVSKNGLTLSVCQLITIYERYRLYEKKLAFEIQISRILQLLENFLTIFCLCHELFCL